MKRVLTALAILALVGALYCIGAADRSDPAAYEVTPEMLAYVESVAIPMPLLDPPDVDMAEWLPPATGLIGLNAEGQQMEYTFPDIFLDKAAFKEDLGEPESLPGKEVQITNTTSFPWRSVCKVYSHFSWGWTQCSGAFIADNHMVQTAGHCVYDYGGAGWSDSWIIVPAYDEGDEPYGSKYGTQQWTITNYVDTGDWNYDWGMIEVEAFSTGYMGKRVEDASWYVGKTFNTAGYPADGGYPGDEMWYDWGSCSSATDYRINVDFDFTPKEGDGKGTCYGGQSGSPIWYYVDPDRWIVAVLTHSDCSGKKLEQWLSDWLDGMFVEVADFEVVPADSEVLIRWATSYEENNAGWNIYRAVGKSSDYEIINESIIAPYQHSYEYTDADVANGTNYCYKIEAVGLDGTRFQIGPECATPDAGADAGSGSADFGGDDDDSVSATGGCGW